jgi:poly[(R)-3-hydroxyalkanoate] polymerase subunit PhaC
MSPGRSGPSTADWICDPAALKRAFETGGASGLAGARNFLHDVAHNGGRPHQVDRTPFELGRNLAATPGQVVFLADVKSDTYLVGAVNDHIVPWPSSYQAVGLLSGTVRYVLSSGGHIAGIVNPPGPKAWYEAAEQHLQDRTQWQEAAKRHQGSWWEDWAAWADARAGQLGPPPPMGSERFPAVGQAPGEYIRG